MTQDTNEKVKNAQLDTTSESQEVSPFPTYRFLIYAALLTLSTINKGAQRHKKTQDRKNINDPQKKYRYGTVSNNILLEGYNWFHGANLTLNSDID